MQYQNAAPAFSVRPRSWILALLMLSLQACATTYYAKPTSATVVDAETGAPLEGVHVVAKWRVLSVTGRFAGELEVSEAVTDGAGNFTIEGWGPKALSSDLPSGSRLGQDSPSLIFFKPDYVVRSLGNNSQPLNLADPAYTGPSLRYSDWNGKTIRLEKFKGTREEYAANAAGATGYLSQAIPCEWKKIPRLLVELMKEEKKLNRAGLFNRLPSIDALELAFKNSKCGSAKEFFKEYMQ